MRCTVAGHEAAKSSPDFARAKVDAIRDVGLGPIIACRDFARSSSSPLYRARGASQASFARFSSGKHPELRGSIEPRQAVAVFPPNKKQSGRSLLGKPRPDWLRWEDLRPDGVSQPEGSGSSILRAASDA